MLIGKSTWLINFLLNFFLNFFMAPWRILWPEKFDQIQYLEWAKAPQSLRIINF